jgi:hypothetical protein
MSSVSESARPAANCRDLLANAGVNWWHTKHCLCPEEFWFYFLSRARVLKWQLVFWYLYLETMRIYVRAIVFVHLRRDSQVQDVPNPAIVFLSICLPSQGMRLEYCPIWGLPSQKSGAVWLLNDRMSTSLVC